MEKLIVTMTADELRAVMLEVVREATQEITKAISTAQQPQEQTDTPQYVVGMEALASLWGVTERTARKRVESGALEGAVKKECGVVITNAPLALKKWSEHVKKTKARR